MQGKLVLLRFVEWLGVKQIQDSSSVLGAFVLQDESKSPLHPLRHIGSGGDVGVVCLCGADGACHFACVIGAVPVRLLHDREGRYRCYIKGVTPHRVFLRTGVTDVLVELPLGEVRPNVREQALYEVAPKIGIEEKVLLAIFANRRQILELET